MVQVSSTMLAKAACWLLASSGFLLVSGSPLGDSGPAGLVERLPGASKTTLIHWKGTLEEGKPEFELSGYSFQEIEAAAKALNPEYTIFAKDGEADTPAYNLTARDLSGRQTQTTNCWQPSSWGVAPNWNAVWDGVHWLQSLTGNCRADPGPGACVRVACASNSGIFYCNDNAGVEHWEPCRWIGDVAGGIANNCNAWRNVGTGTQRVVHGQAFDLRKWNTIVAYSGC